MTEIPAHWELTKPSGSLGTEITSIRLADASDADIALVRKLLVKHMVLFFSGQSPTAEEHTEFGRHFGPLEGHQNLSDNSGRNLKRLT